MSHQQIPLHMHGLKDPLGLYCSEKKNKLNSTQNKQAVQHSAPARLARGRGRHSSALCCLEPPWPERCPGVTSHRHVLPGDPFGNCSATCLETGWLIASAHAGRVIFWNQLPLVAGNLQVCSPELSTGNFSFILELMLYVNLNNLSHPAHSPPCCIHKNRGISQRLCSDSCSQADIPDKAVSGTH